MNQAPSGLSTMRVWAGLFCVYGGGRNGPATGRNRYDSLRRNGPPLRRNRYEPLAGA